MHHDPFDLSAAQLYVRCNELREQRGALFFVTMFWLLIAIFDAYRLSEARDRVRVLEDRLRAQEAIQPVNEVLSKLMVREFTSTWCWDVPAKEPGTVEAACWFRFPERTVRMP